LHLVGILFPHINDDARSKSHQLYRFYRATNFDTNSQIALHTQTFFLFTSRYFRRTLRSVHSCLLPYFATCFDTTAPSSSGVHVKFQRRIAPPPSHTLHCNSTQPVSPYTTFTNWPCMLPCACSLCGTNCLFRCHAELFVF